MVDFANTRRATVNARAASASERSPSSTDQPRPSSIHPFYTPRSDPDKVDVNVRCLAGVDLAQLSLRGFDGQNWEHAIGGAHWQRHSG